MTSSRRGFFATLAALPAVVMGRKAKSEPEAAPFFVPSGSLPPPSWQFIGGFEPGRVDFALRKDGLVYTEQRRGRRLGS
jgi:hypothetical protein